MAADGTGEAEHLMTIDDALSMRPYAWSADGNTLVFEYETTEAARNIGTLSLEGERTWEPLLDTIADEFSPAIWTSRAIRTPYGAEVCRYRLSGWQSSAMAG